MNIKKPYHKLLIMATTLLICGGLVSCSQDEFGFGEQYNSDKYRLRFTATVEGMVARSEGKTAWNYGDVIGVKVGDYAYHGRYKLNADGTINEALDAASWLNEDPGTVIGWYPIEPQTDVAISDQTDGFDDFDYLTAIEENQTYKSMVRLTFRHQMAKVSCKLVAGDGITNADLKTAIVYFTGCTNVSFNEGVMTGSGDGWVTTTPDHEALLVPQQITNRPFIKIDFTVTVNGNQIPKTLTYTPRSDDANLIAGMHHTYTITVNKDRLVVQTISGAWTESLENTEPTSDKYQIYLPENTEELGELEFSKNVIPKGTADTRAGSDRLVEVIGDYFTISYKVNAYNCHLGIVFADKNTKNHVSRVYYEIPNASSVDGYYEFIYTIASPIGEPVYLEIGEHIEVGDILFLDGKWGSISKNIYESEELPNEDKKIPVGIVFRVGAGGDDTPANYNDCEGWNGHEIRGYAVALNDASDNKVSWCTTYKQIFFPAGSVDIYYSGLYITNELKEIIPTKKLTMSNFPAIQKAEEYNSKTASPEGTSGWYLPSYPQVVDIRKLFVHPQRRQLIPNAGGVFLKAGGYWSVTEISSTNARAQTFDYTTSDWSNSKAKTSKNYVRTALTF